MSVTPGYVDNLRARIRELEAALRWARDGFVIHAKGAPAYVSRIDAALAGSPPSDATVDREGEP